MYHNVWKDKMYPLNGIRVCVDGCDRDLQGRIYSRIAGGCVEFKNCGELLLWADRMFDEEDYPQAFNEKRSFREKTEKTGLASLPLINQTDRLTEVIREQTGRLDYFDILVETRMRAGWQGTAVWPQEGKDLEFAGEISLLRYLRRKYFSEEQFAKFSRRTDSRAVF